MDGAMLLSHDPARGVQISVDQVIFPAGNGIGATLIEEDN
jgi:hypothetical protein